jgi:hypothetical protein
MCLGHLFKTLKCFILFRVVLICNLGLEIHDQFSHFFEFTIVLNRIKF